MTIEDDENVRPNPAWKIALVAMPAFLVLSTAISIFVWWQRGMEEEVDPRLALASGQVSEAELLDHMHKLTVLVGARSWASESGRANLRRTMAFIDGTLGPQNYGLTVRRGAQQSLAEELWPVLSADLPGKGPGVVFVVAPYDREATTVALALAAANQLRGEEMERTVRFVFPPSELVDEGIPVPDLLLEGESGPIVYNLAEQGEFVLPETTGGAVLAEAARRLVGEVRTLSHEGGKMP